jgi:hypothetical protein
MALYTMGTIFMKIKHLLKSRNDSQDAATLAVLTHEFQDYFLIILKFLIWLKHYATSQKAMNSRPDEVNEFFQFT